MRFILQLLFLILVVNITESSIYSNIKENIFSFLQRTKDNDGQKIWTAPKQQPASIYTIDTKGKFTEAVKRKDLETKLSKNRAMVKNAKIIDKKVNKRIEVMTPHIRVTTPQHHFHMDPILNFIKRRSDFRRINGAGNAKSSTEEDTSSSKEMKKWKDEWKEHWVLKKVEAINSSIPVGDTVNMVAARPWGVPCGDPNQHDVPWGSCMLPMECDPEYRVYRGDYFCGRTQFVCCALQLNTYDMYQAFDVSFADSNLSTDSEERKNRGKGSKERKRRRKIRNKKKRRKARLKRKRKIKRNIRKIIREITRILNRSYRNGTLIRKRKTKELKKFIKDLKKQYKKDRNSVKEIHEITMLNMDGALIKKLQQIKNLNNDFIKNSTFRDIIVNGTVNLSKARMLMQAYPELRTMLETRRGGNNVESQNENLEYDLEYGMLYYE